MKIGHLSGIIFIVLVAIITSCSKVNINDEKAVLMDIQGTWTGYENIGNIYRHIRLNISESSFDGWVQASDSASLDSWTDLPNESGTFSLSSVIEDPNEETRFRKFTFSVAGRCCGDKSLAIETLSKLLSYYDGKGLYIGGKVAMTKN